MSARPTDGTEWDRLVAETGRRERCPDCGAPRMWVETCPEWASVEPDLRSVLTCVSDSCSAVGS